MKFSLFAFILFPFSFKRDVNQYSLSRFAQMLMALVLFLTVTLTSFVGTSLAVEITSPEAIPAAVDGTDIAAEKIDQFAQAYLQVLALLSDRESEISAAETTAEALKIEQSIEADAVRMIQESGLTMPEYMQILGLASQDETFQAQVLGRMDESGEER